MITVIIPRALKFFGFIPKIFKPLILYYYCNYLKPENKKIIGYHDIIHLVDFPENMTSLEFGLCDISWSDRVHIDLDHFEFSLLWSICPYQWTHDITLRIPPCYNPLNYASSGWLCLKELVTVKAFLMCLILEFTLYVLCGPSIVRSQLKLDYI